MTAIDGIEKKHHFDTIRDLCKMADRRLVELRGEVEHIESILASLREELGEEYFFCEKFEQ